MDCSEEWGNKLLLNVRNYTQVYIVTYPRKFGSSSTPLWEQQCCWKFRTLGMWCYWVSCSWCFEGLWCLHLQAFSSLKPNRRYVLNITWEFSGIVYIHSLRNLYVHLPLGLYYYIFLERIFQSNSCHYCISWLLMNFQYCYWLCYGIILCLFTCVINFLLIFSVVVFLICLLHTPLLGFMFIHNGCLLCSWVCTAM